MNKWAAMMKEFYCPTVDYNTGAQYWNHFTQLPWLQGITLESFPFKSVVFWLFKVSVNYSNPQH